VLAGVAAIVLLLRRSYALARISSSLAVAAILIGWATAQYPYVLPPTLTIEQAARGRTTLVVMLVALVIGSLILIPALYYLYTLFQRGAPTRASEGAASPSRPSVY